MDGQQALRAIVARAGISRRKLSQDLGRAPTYITSTITQAARPTADTLALIASACGYRLALIPRGQDLPSGALEIDPH